MGVREESARLRAELKGYTASPEWGLLMGCDLLAGKKPAASLDGLWRGIRRGLNRLKMLPPQVTPYPWLPGLKHVPAAPDARSMTIWALDTPKADLRQACETIATRLKASGGWIPVLVTNVPDFAWYARLGWLVEYLPDLPGGGAPGRASYVARKKRYLAWRYRDALAIPVSVGLADEAQWQALLDSDTV